MQVKNQRSSDSDDSTLSNLDSHTRHLTVLRIVGTALFDYQVRKTEVARIRLQCLTSFAKELGEIDAAEFAVVARLLARPSKVTDSITTGSVRHVG